MNASSALELWELLTRSGRMSRRSRKLLRSQDGSGAEDWFMHLPSCFNDALDIKENCGPPNPGWTQSGGFSFRKGDHIYNTSAAYQEWGTALKQTQFCFIVRTSSASGNNADGSRYPGDIVFSVLRINADRTGFDTLFDQRLSQDDFVHVLIAGPTGELAKRLS